MNNTRSLAARAVFFGFATSIAGWIVAYALRLPGDVVPPVALGVAIVLAQGVGAFFAGRSAPGASSWLTGLCAGLVTGLLNLLIVLSAFAGEPADGDSALHPMYAVVAYLPLSAVLGALGGFIGGCVARSTPPRDENWLGRFALLNTAGALVLLIVGGIVTSAGAGLDVPDWPTTFGANMFLFPLSKMTGGVFIEHAHRLLAVLVALTTAALLVWTLISRVSSGAKIVAVLASVLVISQAVLGGLRVTHADPAPQPVEVIDVDAETAETVDETRAVPADNVRSNIFRVVHGVVGQIYVATLGLLAAMLTLTWRSDRPARPDALANGQRTLNMLALIALILQIALGAAVRHFDLQTHALMTHMTWSVVALMLLLAAGVRAQKRLGPNEPVLRRCGAAVKHSVLFQMTLGVIVLIAAMMFHSKDPNAPLYIALRAPHQVIGNLLLIAMVWLTAWTIRLTLPTPATDAPAAG